MNIKKKYFDKKEHIFANALKRHDQPSTADPIIFESGDSYGEALFVLPINI